MKTAIVDFKAYLQRRYPDRSTGKHYVSDLTIFSQFVGKTSPRDITVKTIDAFVQAQQAAKLKPATINRRLSAISSFFEFLIAEAEDDTWRNPVRWKRHSVRTGHHLPRDVSDEIAEALLSVVNDPRDRAIFTLSHPHPQRYRTIPSTQPGSATGLWQGAQGAHHVVDPRSLVRTGRLAKRTA